jgi:hypothetical protein
VHASDDDTGFVRHVLSMFPESRRSSRTGESENTAPLNEVCIIVVAKNLRTRNCLALLELRRDLEIGSPVWTTFAIGSSVPHDGSKQPNPVVTNTINNLRLAYRPSVEVLPASRHLRAG